MTERIDMNKIVDLNSQETDEWPQMFFLKSPANHWFTWVDTGDEIWLVDINTHESYEMCDIMNQCYPGVEFFSKDGEEDFVGVRLLTF